MSSFVERLDWNPEIIWKKQNGPNLRFRYWAYYGSKDFFCCYKRVNSVYSISFHIIPSGATLNRRSELFSVCTHRWQKLLSKVWGRKFPFRFGKQIKTPRNSLVYPLRCWRLWYLCVIWNKFVQPYMCFHF